MPVNSYIVQAEIHENRVNSKTGIHNENYREDLVRYLSPEGMKYMKKSVAIEIRDKSCEYE
jgi:hypothetical protein